MTRVPPMRPVPRWDGRFPCPWCGGLFEKYGDQLRHQVNECEERPDDGLVLDEEDAWAYNNER